MDKEKKDKMTESYIKMLTDIDNIFNKELEGFLMEEAFAIGMEVLVVIIVQHIEACSPGVSLINKSNTLDYLLKKTKDLLRSHSKKHKTN